MCVEICWCFFLLNTSTAFLDTHVHVQVQRTQQIGKCKDRHVH